jgi:NitT/TauT family transport system permease protein
VSDDRVGATAGAGAPGPVRRASAPPWFAVRRELSGRRQSILWIASFLLPLGLWCAISYVPFLWHPQMLIVEPGGSAMFQVGMLINKSDYAEENARLVAQGKAPGSGDPANPIFLPAPHQVAHALVSAYSTEPRRGDKWLHEALWHSIQIIAAGFVLSCLVAVPLGIICGTWSLFSRLFEPFLDFVRYMPAPAFGALAVAISGIHDGPKVAIIFLGTFFQMVLVIANTTRQLDRALLEAAQTLGAKNRQLVMRVILPGIMPNLYTDLRVLLGWAWTYLIVAELIGASSGISYFINQQGKYRNYANVFAGIITIGVIGLLCDQFFGWMGRLLFPYAGAPPSRASVMVWRFLTWPVRTPIGGFKRVIVHCQRNLAEAEAARTRTSP